jgi:hypothetical protein
MIIAVRLCRRGLERMIGRAIAAVGLSAAISIAHVPLGYGSNGDYDRYLQFKVTADGLGPLGIGMTIDDFQTATRGAFHLWNRDQAPECFYALTARMPTEDRFGLQFVIVKGRIDAIKIRHPQIRTELGVGVGSPETAVRDAFPGRFRAKTWQESGLIDKPTSQLDGRYVLVVENVERGTDFIFSIDRGLVTGFAVGTRGGIIEAYDGCL